MGEAHGERCCYVVLTTLPGATVADLHRWWRALVKQIGRRWGHVEYHAIAEVGELHGMLHLDVLWRGPYVDQRWLAERWGALSGAHFVRVERVKWGAAGRRGLTRYHAKGLAEYHAKAPVAARVWVSQGWLPAGTGAVWRTLWAQYWRGQYVMHLNGGSDKQGDARRLLWRLLMDGWESFLRGTAIEVQGMRGGWRYHMVRTAAGARVISRPILWRIASHG